MKRTLLLAFAAASLAVASAAQACELFGHKIVGYTRSAIDFVARFAFKVAAGPAPIDQEMATEPSGHLVVAKAFVQRVLKRERPVVTATWRMCPSI